MKTPPATLASSELFRTVVEVPEPSFRLGPAERVLFVGSCFADHMARLMRQDHFPVTANPLGVMYNPASVLHTLQHLAAATPTTAPAQGTPGQPRGGFDTAILTLGTNHVYVEKATGLIVDNCQKRPAQLFEERVLTPEACVDYLQQCVAVLRRLNARMRIIVTVSPLRYRKYGYHESQLSKATLLLAVDRLLASATDAATQPQAAPAPAYFPAYEILLDELRDYRFYQPDMIHPSDQAVAYIYRRFQESFFSAEARQYAAEWAPIGAALAHRPFNPGSAEHEAFVRLAQQRQHEFEKKWGTGV